MIIRGAKSSGFAFESIGIRLRTSETDSTLERYLMRSLNIHQSDVKPKRDLVTVLAITLFVIIVLFEIGLVVCLPMVLSQPFVDPARALQEVIELEDGLRSRAKSAKPANRLQEGEVQLVKMRLDYIARYLRTNDEKLTPPQVQGIKNDLQGFGLIISRWPNGFYANPETVNGQAFRDKLLKDCGLTPPGKTERKSEDERGQKASK